MCRVEFSKIGKRDVTFIREMRVNLHFLDFSTCTYLLRKTLKNKCTHTQLGEATVTTIKIACFCTKKCLTSKVVLGVDSFYNAEVFVSF